MMKKELFAQYKNSIRSKVKAGRLREAFALTRSLSEGAMEWEVTDTLSGAEDAYRHLLEYAVTGAEDPGRQQMITEIGETILTVADRLDRINSTKDASTLYYNIVRFNTKMPEDTITSVIERYKALCSQTSLLDLVAAGTHSGKFVEATTRRESLERRIFELIWTAFPLSTADTESIRGIVRAGILPDYAITLITWALILGGMEFFDPRRISLLCDLYTDGTERTTAVALVGLLIVMHRWRDRDFTRSLRDRLEAVRELPQWRADLKAAYMELTRTRDTDRISAKIRDEIVPGMMKLRPDLERKLSSGPQPLSPEEMEENPEWAEMLDKSGMSEKLKEMSEIQEEGGDVMMGTFSHLKQFPFFNDIANWFIPFHSGRSEFADSSSREGISKIAEMFEQLRFLCDSDKYSLLMSLGAMPEAQRAAVVNQLNVQADQFNEMQASTLDLPASTRREIIARQVQNLFRFFRLFRRKGEFYNPFAEGVNLAAVPALVADVKEEELLTLIAEFLFSHDYHREALEVFEIIDSIAAPSAGLYQKMGHSYMKLGKTSEALSYFEKADMLDNRSAWTLERLGRCHAMLGHHNSALSAFERLEELRPDRPANSIAMGRQHLALEHYPEAVNCFYKAFYLDEESGRAIRPLAWSLLVDKQFDQSRKYYERILTDFDPKPEDYLNLGHLSLATGLYQEARNFYKLSILSRPRPAGTSWATLSGRPASDSEIPRASIESFMADMKADTPALQRLGISSTLIPLISDSLLYALN